jgi:hypothetical protein
MPNLFVTNKLGDNLFKILIKYEVKLGSRN